LKETAERLAAADGVSLNTWINVALAQKIGAVLSVEQMLAERRSRATEGGLASFLSNLPDAPPVPGDEIPDDIEIERDGGDMIIRRKGAPTT
jgi:hypothetical protein